MLCWGELGRGAGAVEEGGHGFREAGVRLDLVGLVAGGCFVGLCGLVVFGWLVGDYV